jgi:hypothetical protein
LIETHTQNARRIAQQKANRIEFIWFHAGFLR